MDQHPTKQDVAHSYIKMREFLQFMASRPDLSGELFVAEFGCALVWAKGATEAEARAKITEKASKPF